MNDTTKLDLDHIAALFEQHEIFAHPSEVHGAISGLLCGGTPLTDTDWLGPLADFYHQGLEFPQAIVEQLELMFKSSWQDLVDENLPFQMLLPDEQVPLSLRAVALSGWTQGFLLGFGTNKNVLAGASKDVNEVIQDFAEISKMTADLEDNEENETAYFEIYEYVRISAVMCFSELGHNPMAARDKITLH